MALILMNIRAVVGPIVYNVTKFHIARTGHPHGLYLQARCAGHAKWQNIKNTKQANDSAKAKMISRYVVLVRRAIIKNNRQRDPKLNAELAGVLADAQKSNVPKATLERAIERAVNLKVISTILEIEGPGGTSIMLKVETENISLLKRDVKKVAKKFGANLLADDSIKNMFASKGFIRAKTKTKDGRCVDEDYAQEAAIISNALDVSLESVPDEKNQLQDNWVFTTESDSLNPCRGELEKLGLDVISSDLDLVPYRAVDFGPDILAKTLELCSALREVDQIVDIYHNVLLNYNEES